MRRRKARALGVAGGGPAGAETLSKDYCVGRSLRREHNGGFALTGGSALPKEISRHTARVLAPARRCWTRMLPRHLIFAGSSGARVDPGDPGSLTVVRAAASAPPRSRRAGCVCVCARARRSVLAGARRRADRHAGHAAAGVHDDARHGRASGRRRRDGTARHGGRSAGRRPDARHGATRPHAGGHTWRERTDDDDLPRRRHERADVVLPAVVHVRHVSGVRAAARLRSGGRRNTSVAGWRLDAVGCAADARPAAPARTGSTTGAAAAAALRALRALLGRGDGDGGRNAWVARGELGGGGGRPRERCFSSFGYRQRRRDG